MDRLRAARLLSRLCESSGRAVDLRINNNRSTLLSVTRPRNGAIRFSVHRMFLDAPAEVVAALAAYMVGARGRGCEGLLRTYMDEQSARMDAASPDQDGDADASHRRAVLKNLRARGAVYDLHRLAEEVNRDYFGGDVRVNITWSRGAREPRSRNGFRRHIIFGSYDRPHALVRIHPALDSADVPEFFVKFVIYHEMLHHVLDDIVAILITDQLVAAMPDLF